MFKSSPQTLGEKKTRARYSLHYELRFGSDKTFEVDKNCVWKNNILCSPTSPTKGTESDSAAVRLCQILEKSLSYFQA